MRFDISYDEKGAPEHVSYFDGFAHTSRPFDKETDGWMLDQLTYSMFPAIKAGEMMRALVDEVNALRRENFNLQRDKDVWRKAAGYGDK